MESDNYLNPFIKKFKTPSSLYIYDVNTNELVMVDKVVYALIDDIYCLSQTEMIQKWGQQFTEKEILRALEEIANSTNYDNLFSCKRPVEIKPYGGCDIEDQVQADVYEHLILNVTEKCNLRCKYCVYSGKYPGRRVHSTNEMSWETAEKALDYFLVKSRKCEEPHIGFFGGEPLCNFDLIKNAISYVEHREPDKYSYSMTSNGTLLNEDIMKFLIDKEFKLRISLDGPEEVHNQCRVNQMGQGTWNLVMKNVERLYTKSPGYFEKNVSIMALIASENYFVDIKEFFEEHELLSKIGVSISLPNYTPNQLFDDVLPATKNTTRNGRRELWSQCATNLNENKGLTSFMEPFFLLGFSRIYHRDTYANFDGGIHINGCCFPGHRRLFVDCAGSLFVCERLDDGYSLGDVSEGINPTKVQDLIDDYQGLCSTCLDCWAVRFCPKCFTSFFSGGQFDMALRNNDCQSYRDDLEQTFILYHQVLEKNPRAFHFLKDVNLS